MPQAAPARDAISDAGETGARRGSWQ